VHPLAEEMIHPDHHYEQKWGDVTLLLIVIHSLRPFDKITTIPPMPK